MTYQQPLFTYENVVGEVLHLVSLEIVKGPGGQIGGLALWLDALLGFVVEENTPFKKELHEIAKQHQQDGVVTEEERLEQLKVLVKVAAKCGVIKRPHIPIEDSSDVFTPERGVVEVAAEPPTTP